jgi:hypothetical protein
MDWIAAVVKARFLVASLGEDATPPWWRSQATSAVGQRMLGRLFPRTTVAASLETASRAARLEHDAHLGRLGVYHLFRLPVDDEAAILDQMRSAHTSEGLQSLATLDGTEERLRVLGVLAGGARASAPQGPVHSGAVDDLRRGASLAQICAAYLAGFEAGTPTYPYLEDRAR